MVNVSASHWEHFVTSVPALATGFTQAACLSKLFLE
jgi:hypothetical protein